MKTKLMVGITAAAISLGGLGVSWADSDERGERRGDRLDYIAEELELTAEQKQQLADAMKSHREARREGRGDHREFRQKLTALNPDATDYQKQLDELVKQAQQRAKEMVLEHAEQQQKFYGILTPEQREEFAELKQNMHKEGHERHSRNHWKMECDD